MPKQRWQRRRRGHGSAATSPYAPGHGHRFATAMTRLSSAPTPARSAWRWRARNLYGTFARTYTMAFQDLDARRTRETRRTRQTYRPGIHGGRGGEASGGKKDDKERPWECCDKGICAWSRPPICQCFDQVERCSNACKQCEEVEGSKPPRYVCKDVYKGNPAPPCKEDDGENHNADKDSEVAVEEEALEGKKNDDEERPWLCCNMAICTRSILPICRCMDQVKFCFHTCKQYEEVEGSNPTLYMCKDVYVGFPGP